MQESARDVPQVSRPAHLACATRRRSISAARPWTSTSTSAGPTSTGPGDGEPRSCAPACSRWAASPTPTPRSSSTSPSCASRSTATARPTWACDAEDIAMAMRLMVGGDDEVSRFIDPTVNEDYDVQVRLEEGDRNDSGTIARLYVPRAGGGLGAARQRGHASSGVHGVAHRPSRSPARGEHPRDASRPATRSAIAWRRCARPRRDLEPARRLLDRRVAAAAASWSARSASSSGRSCSRSRSCT